MDLKVLAVMLLLSGFAGLAGFGAVAGAEVDRTDPVMAVILGAGGSVCAILGCLLMLASIILPV